MTSVQNVQNLLDELDLKKAKTRNAEILCTHVTVISHIQGISWGGPLHPLLQIQYAEVTGRL